MDHGKLLDFDDTINLISSCASALKFLHSNEIIHCDLQPKSICFCKKDNCFKIFDFSFAILMKEESHKKKYHARFLNPRFMAPEAK